MRIDFTMSFLHATCEIDFTSELPVSVVLRAACTADVAAEVDVHARAGVTSPSAYCPSDQSCALARDTTDVVFDTQFGRLTLHRLEVAVVAE